MACRRAELSIMTHNPRDDALAIWQAGVDAVRSDELVRQSVQVHDRQLNIGPFHWPLEAIRHIQIVGAGKAGAGMAAGLEQALGAQVLAEKQAAGWINVPADCLRPLSCIHLHAARAAGRNEPDAAGVVGATEILRRVQSLQPDDLCICLISGGGSALLPAPRPGIDLDDLRQVTQALSAAGATIQQLNAVRKQLSLIQGGRLARACRAGRLVTLVISDVMGDPLDIIASGPTVVLKDQLAATRRAIDVWRQFERAGVELNPAILQLLQADLAQATAPPVATEVINLVIGNNQTATRAVQAEAQRRGYRAELAPAQPADRTAEETGDWLAEMLARQAHDRHAKTPACLISGGEPVVKLIEINQRGRGGRNQQLVLAALCHLLKHKSAEPLLDRQVILSGGTDGEDGPTDAAGAYVDPQVVRHMFAQQLDPARYLRHNDAYTFFQATGGLIRTGPTHTNVCDIRLALS